MKKFNKVLSVVVASAMVMAMAGCGNTDNGSAATGTNAATESAAADNGAASDLPPVAQQFTDWLYSMVQRSQ
jgi:predicted small secreted protein